MSDSSAQRWLDDVLRAYVAHRPVDATFIGVHDHDHRLPDLSEHGIGDRVATFEGLLARARRLGGERGRPAEPRAGANGAGGRPSDIDPRASRIEAVDVRLATGFLRISLWEASSGHFHRGNPSYYTGEAVFGALSLFLSDFAPLRQRVESAVERLEAVSGFLRQGRRWLSHGPGWHPEWTKRSMRECEGALAFLGEGLETLELDVRGPAGGRDGGGLAKALRRAGSAAARGFSDFHAWLASDGGQPNREVGCGPEILDLHIRDAHFLRSRAGEISGAAREELESTRAWLAEHAAEFGARTPEEALAGLRHRHPGVDSYLDRYQQIWEACRELAVRQELVTWPDFPIRYIPRPRWARAAAPYLYFLFYRSPAAYHRPEIHEYLVSPLPEDGDGEGANDPVLEFLRAQNDAVIRANHVIHHGGLGHHVQNWHAFRAPSRIGRIAAVDGPARIAMHCGGTMAEGWACYATDLMAELAEAGVEGGMTPLEAYAERASRIRMCCRAIVDVELHSGGMDLESAAAFYREEAGMTPEAAMGEAVKNSMFPGMALIYQTGLREIHRLRDELSASLGAAFDLRTFHDRLLSWGSIPVTLAGELTREALTSGPRPPMPVTEAGE